MIISIVGENRAAVALRALLSDHGYVLVKPDVRIRRVTIELLERGVGVVMDSVDCPLEAVIWKHLRILDGAAQLDTGGANRRTDLVKISYPADHDEALDTVVRGVFRGLEDLTGRKASESWWRQLGRLFRVVGTILVLWAAPAGAQVTNPNFIIFDESVQLPARARLNFLGTSITCVDNPATGRIDCTVTGGGSALTVDTVCFSVANPDVGLARDAAGVLRVTDCSTGTRDLKLRSLLFGTDTQFTTTANVLTQSNGASPQLFRLDDGATNYLTFDTNFSLDPGHAAIETGNRLWLSTAPLGCCTNGKISFAVGGAERWAFTHGLTDFGLVPSVDNTYDIGSVALSDLRPRNVYAGTSFVVGAAQTITGYGGASALANAAVTGTATTISHSDHQHKRDVRVAKAGVDVGTRNRLNLIEGTNVTLTVTDDPGSDEVDVTVNASGGGGSANTVEVSIVLGNTGYYSTVVTGQAWVGASSVIACSPFGTTADGGTPELTAIANLSASVNTRVAGTGFTLSVYNPVGASGTYRFHCTGA